MAQHALYSFISCHEMGCVSVNLPSAPCPLYSIPQNDAAGGVSELAVYVHSKSCDSLFFASAFVCDGQAWLVFRHLAFLKVRGCGACLAVAKASH